jgi:hypothetical protein
MRVTLIKLSKFFSSPKILKANQMLVTFHTLHYFYNNSVLPGIFPDRLKLSIIEPIYKKGDRISLTSYRPVS